MNAGEQSPFTPFMFVVARAPAAREAFSGKLSSQNCAAGLHAQQCLFDFRARKPEQLSKLRSRGWTQMRHPACYQRQQRIVGRGQSRSNLFYRMIEPGFGEEQRKCFARSAATQYISASVFGAGGASLFEQSFEIALPFVHATSCT